MTRDHLGQLIFGEDDLVDLIMQGKDIANFDTILVDHSVNLPADLDTDIELPQIELYDNDHWFAISQKQFDYENQQCWNMPEEYQNLDIAEYVLDLCTSDAQLQRVGKELLLYQEKNLFDLLKYLKYLVDTMYKNNIIWGVGRGSSVASYVLYLLEVHKIDSLYYQLNPEEFLR